MVTPVLGIDWGTSNRRAYLIDERGKLLRRHADGQGLLAVQGRFPAALAELRRQMEVAGSVPVVMAGMVGSAGGWQEVPYLDISVPLQELPRHLAALRADAACAIVPGYRTGAPDTDVMRGEETQLLGALALGVREGWVVLPGTHSKWVRLRDGRIDTLATYMTGELFAMLGAGGTLGGLMSSGAEEEGAFADGLAAARRGLPLTRSLFGVRARVVTGEMQAGSARGFVSGLLIGTEFAAAENAPIHIIASDALAGRYLGAAHAFGLQAAALDPDLVFIAALKRFIQKA